MTVFEPPVNQKNSPPTSSAARLKVRLAWFLLLVVAGGIVATSLWKWSQGKGEGKALPELGTVSPFDLVASNGQKFSLENLKGKAWIADFIFTRCSGPCPIMSLQMGKLQEMLKNEEGVQLVTFTVDPEFDTPPVLANYAKTFHAQDGKWVFLTGDTEKVLKVAREGFKVVAEKNPEYGKDPGQGILHSTFLILVDGNGKIRGYYPGDQEEGLANIVRDAKRIR